jgi:hypothetical protein
VKRRGGVNVAEAIHGTGLNICSRAMMVLHRTVAAAEVHRAGNGAPRDTENLRLARKIIRRLPSESDVAANFCSCFRWLTSVRTMR